MLLHVGLLVVAAQSSINPADDQANSRLWRSGPRPAASAMLVPWSEPEPEAAKPPPVIEPSPPEPAPPPMDELALGIEEGADTPSPNWVGFKEATEHHARLSEVSQPQLDPEAGALAAPMGGTPGAPGNPGPISTEQPPAPSPEPLPPEQPAAVTPPQSAPEPPAAPPATQTEPSPEGPTQPLLIIAPQNNPAEATDPAPETPAPDLAPPTTQPPELPQPPASDPQTPPQPDESTSPPSPPNPAAPGEAGERGDNAPQSGPITPSAPAADAAPGTPGIASDKQIDASSTEPSTEVRPGKTIAAKGLEIITRRPIFGRVTRVVTFPDNPLVDATFGRDGRVKKARIVTSSGYPEEVDQPVLDAVYTWRAKGKALAKINPLDPDAGIHLKFTIILR